MKRDQNNNRVRTRWADDSYISETSAHVIRVLKELFDTPYLMKTEIHSHTNSHSEQ